VYNSFPTNFATRPSSHILSFSMRLRHLSLLAFVLQITLGDICMMEMASAHEMDMEPMHGTHCENCSPDTDAGKEMPMQNMDCDSGHCLMHVSTEEPTAFQLSSPSSSATLPPSPAETYRDTGIVQEQPPSTAPPDAPYTTHKIVLRF